MKAIVVVASLLAYLAAAKVHGLQLRVERELAGHMNVVFGGDNPPFVVALWQKERVIYWSIAGAVALIAAGYAFGATKNGWPLPLDRSKIGTALLVSLWPMTIAFLASGIVSAARSGAWLAGLGWWALAAISIVVVVVLAFRA